ncbi:MAG TPA: flagellar basal body L-ring protein FlgH [Tepidisphaeraceae bacterium]|nr:flagellar basal body L-ring protein FlgH [Tepidisphaeraceae bacterium]
MKYRRAKLVFFGLVTTGWIGSVADVASAQNAAEGRRGNGSAASRHANGHGNGREQPPKPVHNDGAADAAAAMRRNGNSLLKATLNARSDRAQATLADVSFHAVPEPEPRTLRKHDQVTIIVREESEFSSKGSSEFKKEAEFEARLEEFIALSARNWEIEGGGIGGPVPSIRATGKRDFKGEGSVDRSDSLTTRVQAEVVDVKPNGTLVLQARSRIKTDDEERVFVLTGVCRVEDVSADNTILSTQLYDKNIEQRSNGTVRNASRRGWLSHLLDAISPF